MICILTGPLRNGKNIFACSIMEEAWRAGRALYTNVELTPDCPFYDYAALIGTEDFPIYRGTAPFKGKQASHDYMAFWHYIENGSVVVIDEATTWFDCADNGAMGNDLRNFSTQIGKRGIDLVLITQNIQNLYCRWCRLAQRVWYVEWSWRCSKVPQMLSKFIGEKKAKNLTRFWRAEFNDSSLAPGSMVDVGYIRYGEATRYFSWYHTEQLIGGDHNSAWRERVIDEYIAECELKGVAPV